MKTDALLAVETFVANLIESRLPVEIKYSHSAPVRVGENGITTLEVTFDDEA